MTKRSFLFLQGVASPFFSKLGQGLTESGHSVYKINFCGGEVAYWDGLPSWDFSDKTEALAGFIRDKLERYSIDCIVLFGDNREIHKVAIREAEQKDVQVFVFEEGYIRPNWITLEQSGVNAHSSLPNDPDWYREIGPTLPRHGNGSTVGPSLRTRTLHDMRYHLSNLLYTRRFPNFRTHRPYKAHIEYAGWARRFPTLPFHERLANKTIKQLVTNKVPFFVFPLQLNADTQIREHSRFSGMEQAITTIVKSFAEHADRKDTLVVKNHPLDTGLIDYRSHLRSLIKKYAIDGRVLYIDGGHLPTLLRHTKGTITINSTVGISAIFHASPTIALGDAIYNFSGLTYQGQLDNFWNDSQVPDKELSALFRNTVIHLSQVNGGFYTQTGINMALEACMERLQDKASDNAIEQQLATH